MKGGGKRLTKKAEQYFNQVNYIARDECIKQGWKQEYNSVWYIIELTFYFPDKRIRDNHNMFKVLFDGIEGVCFPNDYYIMPRVLDVHLDRENPRVELTIKVHPKSKK